MKVIVVAYGDPAHLERCLDALGATFTLVVVDNSSNADTERLVLGRGGQYIDPGRNLGFGAAVNLGLVGRDATPADVLLLNPDAMIDAADIGRLQEELRAGADLAAIGPRQRPGPGAPLDRVCWPFPSPRRAWLEAVGLAHLGSQCDFVIGSVLLLRHEALLDIGGFDERFFLYAEETDWQWRAHLRGWRSMVSVQTEAEHLGAATDTDVERREVRFHAGTERYIRKWYGGRGWATYRTAAVVGAAIRAAARSGPKRTLAVGRATLYLRGPLRVARASSLIPETTPRIPRLP